MKNVRKLQDGIGSAVGSVIGGLPIEENISESSIRPKIYAKSERLRQTDLKRHEIEYMDLTRAEKQFLQKRTKPEKQNYTLPSDIRDFTKNEEEKGFFKAKVVLGAFLLVLSGLIFFVLV